MSAMNLLLVTVDCLRADHASLMGYRRPTTPALDALARESVVFEQAHAAGAPTFFSFPALLGGRYPLSLGRDVVGLPRGARTLAAALRDAGYTTAGFVAGNYYVSRWAGYQQGFEVWEDFLAGPELAGDADADSREFKSRLNARLARLAARLPGGKPIYNELYFRYLHHLAVRRYAGQWDKARRYPPAAALTERAAAWLRTAAASPFFLWLHYMDAHHPRFPSAESLSELGAARIGPERALWLNTFWRREGVTRRELLRRRRELVQVYDASIRDVDRQVGLLLTELERMGERERTAIVVTSDHGEEFLEHGGMAHTPPQLYQELLHVPLVVNVPGLKQGRRISSPFSQVNLVPTLLQMLGANDEGFEGKARWEQVAKGQPWEGTIVAEAVAGCSDPNQKPQRLGGRLLAVRDARYKLILNFAEDREEFYDLALDPTESRPLAAGRAVAARGRLLRAAREHLAGTQAGYKGIERLRGQLSEVKQSLVSQSGAARSDSRG